MRISWRTEWPQWVVIAAAFLLAAVTWSTTPDHVPMHWNVYGEVDRYGGKFEGLLFLPLFMLGLYLLLLFVPRLDPGRANYAQFAGAYTAIRTGSVVLIGAIYGLVHLWLRGYQVPVEVVMPVLVGSLFVVLGNLMGKI